MRLRRRTILLALASLVGLFLAVQLLLATYIYRRLPPPPRPALAPLPTLGSLSSTSCAACHTPFYEEWRASAHGMAATDPLYQAEFHREGRLYLCRYCHTPLPQQRPETVHGLAWVWPKIGVVATNNPRYDKALEQEGVTCTVCHQSDGAMVGPHAVQTPIHATRHEPTFGSNDLCRPCHFLDLPLTTGLKRPIQDTFAEWEAYRNAGGDQLCVDCHMPWTEDRQLAPGSQKRRSRSHKIRGPSDLDFLRNGLVAREVSIRKDRQQPLASLILDNRSGHRIPTAEPKRQIVVSFAALDRGGHPLLLQTVTLARRLDPKKPDSLVDLPLGDTTLAPRESRHVTLALQPLPKEAEKLILRVDYYVWDLEDPVVKEAGLPLEKLIRPVYVFEGVVE